MSFYFEEVSESTFADSSSFSPLLTSACALFLLISEEGLCSITSGFLIRGGSLQTQTRTFHVFLGPFLCCFCKLGFPLGRLMPLDLVKAPQQTKAPLRRLEQVQGSVQDTAAALPGEDAPSVFRDVPVRVRTVPSSVNHPNPAYKYSLGKIWHLCFV